MTLPDPKARQLRCGPLGPGRHWPIDFEENTRCLVCDVVITNVAQLKESCPDLGSSQQENLHTTDDEKVAAMCNLLEDLKGGLRSTSRYTVQVMPDGVEVIEVETGNLRRKMLITEVLPDESNAQSNS